MCTRARKGRAASAPGCWQPPRWRPTGVGRRRMGRSDQGGQDHHGQMEVQNLRKLTLQRGRPSRSHTPPGSRWRAALCLDALPKAGERACGKRQCFCIEYRSEVRCFPSRTCCPFRETVSSDFLTACQFLNDHMDNMDNPNNEMVRSRSTATSPCVVAGICD